MNPANPRVIRSLPYLGWPAATATDSGAAAGGGLRTSGSHRSLVRLYQLQDDPGPAHVRPDSIQLAMEALVALVRCGLANRCLDARGNDR